MTSLTTNDVLMAPSILSADFLHLQESVDAVAPKADFIHVDVMDGIFVPNLTIGPMFVRALKGVFGVPLDVHLMVSNPEQSVDWYIDAGADIVTVHMEAVTHAHRLAAHVRSRGCKVGFAVNPATPVSVLRDIVEYADLLLVMSVNPGFGGQSFIPSTPRRIRELRALCEELGSSAVIEVDGGVANDTAQCVVEAGARMLVAGSAVFGQPDPLEAMERIREIGRLGMREER